MVWGFNLGRHIPQLLESDFWAGPLESPYKVFQYGELSGLSLQPAEKKYQVIPHVIGKAEEGKSSELEGGLNVRLAL